MQAVALQAAPEDVRAFIQEYFNVWKGTDEHKILAYYYCNSLRNNLAGLAMACVGCWAGGHGPLREERKQPASTLRFPPLKRNVNPSR
jgi:hypothetical protein